MFNVGDKVVYPMQGIGIIEAIEDKDFSGEKQQYYIIKMITNNMEIMIPEKRVQISNMRLISDASTLENILLNFHNKEWNPEDVLPSKERYQSNMEKIKSGSLEDGAEVIYDLTHMNKEKALNSSEKQMLQNARKFLIDEMSLIKKITEKEAEKLLNASFI
ncbi:CarD family transcriptional regulator [Clostridium sp.]|uniref:CarD family transcriptional regulator n=1 Tax=Clostridium sp. TaxID=1506 RepID=UPI003463DA9E